MSDKKRSLNELRVTDLRAELEKRNLDRSGVRGVLIQRLSKYLEEEGHDPATFKFDLSGTEIKGTPKRTRRLESAAEQDTEETPALDDMIVQDDVAEDKEGDDTKIEESEETEQSQEEEKMEVEESDTANRKRVINDETEASDAKKPFLDKDAANNIENEDSIYLDIGDDELLNEETENAIKDKKDDAANEDKPGIESAADESTGGTDDTPADDQQVNAEAPATSTEGEKNDENEKDDKDKEGDNEKKEESREGGTRNLWVSGLSGDTRAKDLKQLCSKHGKVIGAKVVTNAMTPGSRCYGYVTMAVAQDAEKCIKYLHRTELHGRMISVEKAKSESESSRRQASRAEPSKDRHDDNKDAQEGKGETAKDGVSGANSPALRSTSRSRSRERSHRSDRDRAKRSTRSRDRRRPPRDVLTFSKIWKERDVARTRERSRAVREQDRRRRAAEDALRDRERRQRLEDHRLALERVKLREERERIEREKKDLLKLERERHRLEREKLEIERLELKRAQLRFEEERRKRGYESSAAYRKPVSSPPPEPAYDRDPRHKRVLPPPMATASSRGTFEAPPPPRFDIGSSYERGAEKRDRDYKRDYPRHTSSGNMKYPSNGSTTDDTRQPISAGTRPKEPSSRSYEARDARSYRPSPPGKLEPRSWNTSARYTDPPPPSKGSGGGNEAWSGESRYGGGGAYEPRYPPAYQPPPPGAAYPDRYAPPARDYRKY